MRKKWLTATVVWMTVIFFFTQLLAFNGKNTEILVNKAVEKVGELSLSNATSEPKPVVVPDESKKIDLDLLLRKSVHVVIFGILAVFIYQTICDLRFSLIFDWLLTVVYAVVDEYHHSFIEGRVAAVADVGYDSIGALLPWVVCVPGHIFSR